MRGLSEDCRTNSKILLSHFRLLGNEFSSSFQPLFGAYVFNKLKVSNSAKMTRPSGSCFEANNKENYISWLLFHVQVNIRKRTFGDRYPRTEIKNDFPLHRWTTTYTSHFLIWKLTIVHSFPRVNFTEFSKA